MSNLEIKKNFINKASLVLLGVFIASLILAFMIQNMGTTGVYLGIIAILLIGGLGLYYCKPKSIPRYITYGVLATGILGIVGYVIVTQLITGLSPF